MRELSYSSTIFATCITPVFNTYRTCLTHIGRARYKLLDTPVLIEDEPLDVQDFLMFEVQNMDLASGTNL
jgi:hypothetical protein